MPTIHLARPYEPGWRLRWRRFKKGMFYGYPICCVIRFSLCRPGLAQPLHRGSLKLKSRPNAVFVPCGIFHHAPRCACCNERRATAGDIVCRICVRRALAVAETIKQRGRV